MKRLISSVLLIIALVSLITVFFTYFQVKDEEVQLKNDLQYRSWLLSESLRLVVEPDIASPELLKSTIDKFGANEELIGTSITSDKGENIASSSSYPKNITNLKSISIAAIKNNKPQGKFESKQGKDIYVYAVPLHQDKEVAGALVFIQDAEFIEYRIGQIWRTAFLRLFTQILIIALALFFIFRWIIHDPIIKLVESIKQARLSKSPNERLSKIPDLPFLKPLLGEIYNIKKSLSEARLSASEEARLRLEKVDSPWTEERLKEYAKDILNGQKIVAVSNREPYIHEKKGDKISYFFPASGMATAIESIMQACGGEWVAHGSGSGDRLVVDKYDRIEVPPEDPKYILKRVWLTEKEEKGYYYGFSNEGLWPLCHNVHNRPIFRKEDWIEYLNVNTKFADAIFEEIKDLKNPIIFIQDFHFALLPKMIKEKRPDAQIVLFWHIPWPNSESFGICPFRKELLEGMLGADIIGFHTQLHCNNFIDTVRRELEARINIEKFAITRNDHESLIKPFPISIAFYNDKEKKYKFEFAKQKETLLKELNIESEFIGLGVDRLDYTKGIIERLKSVETFLTKYPEYKNKFVFIQISAPSRSGIKKYDEFGREVMSEVERINNSLKTKNWKPIIYLNRHHSQEELSLYYRIANVFLVTSLHDGMNLIAKEYVAARSDERGVLILSKFAGAAAELSQAFIVNPYNIEGVADTIKKSLEMSFAEQEKRMKKMRKVVLDNNVYKWSAEILKTVSNLE
ncbi:MAG TPA: trehalose-6-phosphate synthase [Candidatus Limnocylindrales bacterium]|nr:trehalose-6-phosphate synthase [Candidatus Limnocylindrales bacterium]